jgi:hypothetical protein
VNVSDKIRKDLVTIRVVAGGAAQASMAESYDKMTLHLLYRIMETASELETWLIRKSHREQEPAI